MERSALRGLAGIAAPPLCAACAAECRAAEVVCGRCERELRDAPALVGPGPPGVDLAVAAAEYAGCARAIAHGLKFSRRLALAHLAADAVARACPAGELRGTVVPVPPAPLRRLWRGFDPAEELALALAELTSLPYAACLRRRSGPRQVGRPRSARLAEPPRVALRGRAPAEALLVDDVRTTGATITACADALRSGGCARIVALTLAFSR